MKTIWLCASTVSLLLISLTMLCRANDLRWRAGLKWQVRFLGFILAGAMPVGIVIAHWYYGTWPSPYETLFYVGLLCVFVTTPHLPPWWRWISGQETANDTN